MEVATSTSSSFAPRRCPNARIESLYHDARHRNSRRDLARCAAEREYTFSPEITKKAGNMVRDDPFTALYVDAHRRRNKLYALSGARLNEAKNKGSPSITARGRKARGKLRGGWGTPPAMCTGAGDGEEAAAAAGAAAATPGVAISGGGGTAPATYTVAGDGAAATAAAGAAAATPGVAISGGGGTAPATYTVAGDGAAATAAAGAAAATPDVAISGGGGTPPATCTVAGDGDEAAVATPDVAISGGGGTPPATCAGAGDGNGGEAAGAAAVIDAAKPSPRRVTFSRRVKVRPIPSWKDMPEALRRELWTQKDPVRAP